MSQGPPYGDMPGPSAIVVQEQVAWGASGHPPEPPQQDFRAPTVM
jgi:hypothetical protein